MGQTILVLGHGTRVRINRIRDTYLQAPRDYRVPIDYDFASRGRLSYFQINKMLSRFLNNALVGSIARDPSNANSSYWRRREQRALRWTAKHLDIQVENLRS